MLRLVRKLDDLVFDRWAIARSDALDAAGVHGRAMNVFADEAQRLGRGECDVAGDLLLNDLLGTKTERRWVCVAGLLLKHLPLNGSAVEARRRAGLQAASPKAQSSKGFPEENAGGLTRAAGGIALFAAMNEAVEKGSSRDDGGSGEELAAVAKLEAENAAVGARGDAGFHRTRLPLPRSHGPLFPALQ